MMIETFAALINRKLVIPSSKTPYFGVDRDLFVTLMAAVIADVYVDEDWYLSHSPDVREAVGRGDFASAADHFVKVGFYEHRMPYPIEVDESWYLESYPDVDDAVRQGSFGSGRSHFYRLGYREGRFPHPGFRLTQRNAVAELRAVA
jgi:hypothetical protein